MADKMAGGQERRGDRSREPGETSIGHRSWDSGARRRQDQRQCTRKNMKILKIKGRIQNPEFRMKGNGYGSLSLFQQATV